MSPTAQKPIKKIPPRPKYKEDTNWVGLIFGWSFIIMSLAVIYYMIDRSKPEGHLVCNRNVQASLTTFGSCRRE